MLVRIISLRTKYNIFKKARKDAVSNLYPWRRRHLLSSSEVTMLIPEPLEFAFSRTGIGGQTRKGDRHVFSDLEGSGATMLLFSSPNTSLELV